MNCTEVREDLEALLDDAVDEKRRQAIELHLASCHSCAARLAQLQSLENTLRESYPINVPASLDHRVLSSFNARHAHAETTASRWRTLFLGSFRIPAPVFGLFLLAAVAAVTVAYWLGKQNGTSIVVAAPPTSTEVKNPIARETPVDNQTHRSDERQTAIAPRRKRPVSQSKHVPLSVQTRSVAQPLRSSTSINANSATYSTVTSLRGFEPLTSATARIIKGDQNK